MQRSPQELLPEQPKIRNCLEIECEHCKESGEISSCSYTLNLVGNHGKSPFAMGRGSPCHYGLLKIQQDSTQTPLCTDYYPQNSN